MLLDLAFGFDFYYAITRHPLLGWIVQPRAVQLTETGKYSLKAQKLNRSTAEVYKEKLCAEDFKIIEILDSISPESLTKQFHPQKKIKPKNFFSSLSKKDFQSEIQPIIEEKLAKAIAKFSNQKIFLEKNDKLSLQPIQISNEIATVLFHFRKTEESTRYFITIKNEGERIHFMKNGSVLLSKNPIWLLAEGKLMTFDQHMDGKKIAPFIKSKFIEIPKRTEEEYFQNFIPQIIENYHVYAQGFAIESIRPKGKAKLLLVKDIQNKLGFELKFDYGKTRVSAKPEKAVVAALDREKIEKTFYRIKRDIPWERDCIKFLEQNGLTEVQTGLFLPLQFRSPIEWIYQYEKKILSKIEIDQSLVAQKYLTQKPSLVLRAENSENNDWFDLKANVHFGSFEIPFRKIIQYIKNQITEFLLPDGTMATIPEEWFTRLDPLTIFNKSNHGISISRPHFALVEHGLKTSLKKDHKFIPFKDVQTPPPDIGDFKLRPYQIKGFQWMQFLKLNHFGGILADDMGLGKTIQTIAVLLNEKQSHLNQNSGQKISQIDLFQNREKNKQTNLIIVPTSLVFNWISEIKKFGPLLKIVAYVGNDRQQYFNNLLNFDVVISTYGIVRNEIENLRNIQFNYLIIDEAQSIKNASSLSNKALLKLQAKHKLALTGTPIENKLSDLWSIMNFLNPGLLGHLKFFQNQFAQPIEKAQDEKSIQTLKTLINPFILRRTKENVLKDLPPINQSIQWCEMTPEQEKFYDQIKSKFRNELLLNIEEKGFEKSKINILSGITQLRLAANHPKILDPNFEGQSGKHNVLIDMVMEAISQNHKVLLFSQFVKQLSQFKNAFEKRNIPFAYIDGQTLSSKRENQVMGFQKDSEIKLFLISLKAGGAGLNLTAADYVFIADPWWNPATEQQAIARAHRIGQTHHVFSYKFISRNSVEEKILQLQEKKSLLAKNFITESTSSSFNLQMDDFIQLFN